MNATFRPPVPTIQARTDAFAARIRAARARRDAERPAPVQRPPSPAEETFAAALADHAARWVQARRDTLRALGSDAEPCRDVRLDLGGDHDLDRNNHSMGIES